MEKVPDEKVPFGRSAGRGGGHCPDDAASDSMRVFPVWTTPPAGELPETPSVTLHPP